MEFINIGLIIVLVIALLVLYKLIREVNEMRLGFTLLIDKFFEQSNTNVKLIDKTINNVSENMNSVIRSIQKVKRDR